MPNQTPETPDQRKARQFAILRKLGKFGMDLTTRAHTQATRQLDAPARTQSRDGFDYAATFATLSRAVRQAIAIEIRLDAPARTRPTFKISPTATDPRRILLTRVFYDAVATDPDRATRRREIKAVIEQRLQADPDHQERIEDTITALCASLGIELDCSRLPDELLDFAPDIPPDQPSPARTGPPARAAPPAN